MKIMKIFFCSLSLILALSTSITVTAQDAVFDNSGQYVRAGVSYYVLPASSGNGGGLSLINRRGRICPWDIFQTPNEGTRGLPVIFTPVNTTGPRGRENLVNLDTDHTVRFVLTPPFEGVCPESPVWRLDASQNASGPLYVTTGGVEGGNPGDDETVASSFKIQKSGDNGYEFQYCPSNVECPPDVFCNIICQYIGIAADDFGRNRLSLNGRTFRVVFQRA